MATKQVIQTGIDGITDGGNNTAAEMRTLLTNMNDSTLSNESFEALSRSLQSLNSTLTYNANGDVETRSYNLPSGGSVIKTFTYNANGDIETIVLSGTGVPAATLKTKTLSYTNGNVTGVVYS